MTRLTVAVACALVALVAIAATAVTAAREAVQPLRFASAAEEAAFHGMLFASFETQFNKRYVPSERAMRYRNFVETVRAVEAHNANPERTYDMGLNEWSDMSEEEFARVMLVDAGEECSLTNTVRMSTLGHGGLEGAPVSVDWREKGVVTAVKNQGRCGSCWSFSSTGVTESAYALATGKLISLSEQQLIDCSRPWGNHGCSGGLPSYSNNYLLHVGGIASEKEYPYQSGEGDDSFACRYKPTMKSAYISSSVNITQFDEKELQIALLNHGPVSVAFQVVAGFKNYAGGVYTSTVCESTPDKMNHGVLAVGFGVTAAGEKYYIVKNSWGESFGLQGYFWIARDQNNMCGIATCASFPIVHI